MIINALRKKYEYEIASAKANIGAYQKNPTGIGEHPEIIEAIETQIEKIANAEEKIATIEKYFSR